MFKTELFPLPLEEIRSPVTHPFRQVSRTSVVRSLFQVPSPLVPPSTPPRKPLPVERRLCGHGGQAREPLPPSGLY